MDDNVIFLPEQVQTSRLELGPWQLLEQCPDPDMDQVKTLVKKSATHEVPVVIMGETGVGKELVAGAIHQLSRRDGCRFEVLDCTNINPHLMGSELFGHERGSFTGADHRHLGQFELANGGTILLDEIGELPMELQIRILRVLESKSFKRVGGTDLVHSDFRLIAATNRNLGEMVEERNFRQDLFYRLNVFPIMVPPLRQRPLDIMCLAKFFAQGFLNGGKKEIAFAPESEQWLLSQSWPGNVRQLRNTVERAMILVNGDGVILPRHLNIGQDSRQLSVELKGLTAERLIASVAEFVGQMPWPELFHHLERAVILREMGLGRSVEQMAGDLGFSVHTLRKRKKEYGLLIGANAKKSQS